MEYKTLETGNTQNNYQWNIKHQKQGTDQNITIKTTTSGMEYKTLETGNSSKHNNQNNYQWNIIIKHNNQNNYQWN